MNISRQKLLRIFFVHIAISPITYHLHALTLIPTSGDDAKKWIRLKYSKIQATDYNITNKQLEIKVRSSASPLLYKFERLKKLKRLQLKATINTLPEIPTEADDFILRIGPAISGTKKLKFHEKLFSPDWVKTLAAIATENSAGFKNLDLSLVALHPSPTWKKRSHPQSELIQESVALVIDKPGNFNLNIDYPIDMQASLGLWIGSDGDNSQSNYELSIDELSAEFYEDTK